MAEGNANIPWTFKDGVYNLKINPDKKIHNANKIKLEQHITKAHVQPNLNAGRHPSHGIKGIQIGDDKGRVGGVESYQQGTELSIKIRNSSAKKQQQLNRNLKNTAFDLETQRQANIYTTITILRNALNKKELSKRLFNDKMKTLFKRNRIQMPGLGVGEYNEAAFNKSPMRNGWPEGVSQESIAKDLKKNYAALKPAQQQAQIKGKGKVIGLGPKVDIGHARQGAANLDMALQPRYHPTKGNQSIRDLAPEYRATQTKANLVVQPNGSLKYDRPISSERLAGSRTNLRSLQDLDTAGVAHRPRHGLERAIINAVKKDSPLIKSRPINSLEKASQTVKSAVLHNTDIPTADAAVMKMKQLDAEAAVRRKITIAQQPKQKPVRIRAKTPPNTLGLKHVVSLSDIKIANFGGGNLLSTDVKPMPNNQNVYNALRMLSNPSNDSWQHPFGGPQIPKF